MTTQFDSVLKGIYTFEGNTLSVCVAKHEDGARPTAFEAPRGSDRMLIRLRLAASDRKPAPSASPPPSSAEDNEAREANIHTNCWLLGHDRSPGTLTIIFLKKARPPDACLFPSAKTIFGAAADSASGTWGFGNGTLEAYVAGDHRSRSGWSPRVRPRRLIGDDTMVTLRRLRYRQDLPPPEVSRGRKTHRVGSAASAESCIRKAVAERGAPQGLVGPYQALKPRAQDHSSETVWYGEQRADPAHDAGLFTGVRTLRRDEFMRLIGWRLPILAMSIPVTEPPSPGARAQSYLEEDSDSETDRERPLCPRLTSRRSGLPCSQRAMPFRPSTPRPI